jgi:hypothetical protein
MDFCYSSYQFILHPFYTGAEGRRNNYLFLLDLGIHIALTDDRLRLSKTYDLWNAFTLNRRILPLAKDLGTWLINDRNMPFRLSRW